MSNVLHTDFLFPSQLTNATHTKCPLALCMNNTNVFSPSTPSWKTRSVSEPLTLACGCASMWQWNTKSSATETECVRTFLCIYGCTFMLLSVCDCAHWYKRRHASGDWQWIYQIATVSPSFNIWCTSSHPLQIPLAGKYSWPCLRVCTTATVLVS